MIENWHQVFIVVIFILVFASFFFDFLPPELVAIFGLILCGLVGILSFQPTHQYYVFSPFIHPAPLTIIAIFILGKSLERTGVIDKLIDYLQKLTRFGELFFLIFLMAIVAMLSCLMNNTPLVVIFIPIVISICQNKGYKLSRFLIPLSYASIAGGTMSVIGTSTNMVANNILNHKGEVPFAMFDLFPLGIIFVVITIVYIAFIGKFLLPNVSSVSELSIRKQREFITHLFVDVDLAGKHLVNLDFWQKNKKKILGIWRNGKQILQKARSLQLQAGDEIVFQGQLESLLSLSKNSQIGLDGQNRQDKVYSESTILTEALVKANSSLIGLSLKEINFYGSDQLLLMAIHRRGKNLSLKKKFTSRLRLAAGDVLLFQGKKEKNKTFFEKRGLLNLTFIDDRQVRDVNKKKSSIALLAMSFFVSCGILTSLGILPNIPLVILAFLAVAITLFGKCLSWREAYDAVEWRVIFLIIGMLGLSMGFERSGIFEQIASFFFNSLGFSGIHWLIPIFYLLAICLTEVMSNNGVAAILTPMAIFTAHQFGISIYPLVAAVMFGASASFLTPVGYQTNLFVYSAGNYRFRDFFIVGLPLALLLFFVACWLIPIIWPLSG